MASYFFVPPLTKFSGGLAVIYQVAQCLHQLGHTTYLVSRDNTTPGLGQAGVPVLNWAQLSLKPQDIWVVPEGWPNALAPGLEAGCCNLVYVQNWAYLFSALPQGVRWQQLDVSFLAVSTPVAAFIKQTIGADAHILRPGIDLSLLCPNPETGNAQLLKSKGPVKSLNIAWMPRKNKVLAVQARQILQARGRVNAHLNWLEISGKSRQEVAAMLQQCHIYLGTGFPEGLGLPPLEAMACGAIPVTCTGYGGWDYLRQIPLDLCKNADLDLAAQDVLAGLLPPNFSNLPGAQPLALPYNAFVTPDADPISMALALEYAASLVLSKGPLLEQILQNGQTTACVYSLAEQKSNVQALWNIIMSRV